MTHIQIIDLQTTLNVEETDTMKQISKIRYDVFCEELKLYPENNQKLSQDNYDSVYIVYKLLGSVKVVGFVSITIPTSKEKSIMKYVKDDIVNNKKYDQFIKRYKKGEYYDNVSVLISEWANAGDMLDYIKANYKTFTVRHWRSMFFQLISVLAIIQNKYPGFRHNDMKANNILIQNRS